MKTIQKFTALTFCVGLAVACGGGGGGSSSSGAQTGVFQDREVAGISYTSASFSGNTDSGGNFQYNPGETISFKVGNVELGSSAGAPVLTPIELVGNVTSGNATVQNMLVFLQSIDSDGNPENGIEITPAVRDAFAAQSLDFKKDATSFGAELDGKLPAGKTRVSHDAARAHFDATLNQVKNGSVNKNYDFSRDGASTVSYTGQVARQALIERLKSYTSGLSSANTHDAVLARLTKLYTAVDHSDEAFVGMAQGTLPYAQGNIQDISSNKNLQAKTAGNDAKTDYKVWTSGNNFRGWLDKDIAAGGGNINTPEGLIWAFFNSLADQVDEINRVDTQGRSISKVYVTKKRQDLNQLIQKFLWGAIAYAQATDDYLSNDIQGKGLMAGNAIVSGKGYTSVEHAWDEAFGYFGATINYNLFSDREIAGKTGRAAFASQVNDANGDGQIDVVTEKIFGHAIYAGKRDIDDSSASLDLSRQAFNAFVAGRQILAKAGTNALTTAEMATLVTQKDRVISYWEKTMLASAAYYINSTLTDIAALKTDLSNDDHWNNYAKHWSELKGFALGLQFNPQSKISTAEFVRLHTYIGDSPELDPSRFDVYIANLEDARTMLLSAAGPTVENALVTPSKLTATATATSVAPTTYTFNRSGVDTVSYTGQTARLALIEQLKAYTGSLTGTETPTAVLTRLTQLYSATDHSSETLSNVLQANINEISSNKNLQAKTAGNDTLTDYKVWTNGNAFKGWNDTSLEVLGASVSTAGSANILTPEGLVWGFFHKLAAQAGNTSRVDVNGDAITKAYVTEKRQDLNQLIQKFLWGAIAYAQATDDYLSDDIVGKGLMAGNTIGTGKVYTNVEHAWDEAFGYFGAPRDYGYYTDKEIAGTSVSTDYRTYRSAYANQNFDSNQDGKIDLTKEQLYGYAIYAGKRDLDNPSSAVNLTQEIFDAFKLGRAIIQGTNTADLSATELSQLKGQRNIILSKWEQVILGNIAHYINEVLTDLQNLASASTADVDTHRNNYAKHWSELKGFALSLQFNPQSRLNSAQFESLHQLIGDSPELSSSNWTSYGLQLQKARDLVLGLAGQNIQSVLNTEFANSGASIGVEAAGDND